MAPARRLSKDKNRSAPPPVSSSFIPAISTVAVAQICRSAGYNAAEQAALRSLTAVAVLYLQTLAKSAASIANSKGRTQSNLLDLIRAIEDIAVPLGFAGAPDPTRPLLRSAVLKDLRSFVRRAKEVPFPKPIARRERAREPEVSSAASFAELGREPPGGHVPRWLPCFPANWERREERRARGEGRSRWEEKGGTFESERRGIEEEEEERVDEKGVGNGGIRGRNSGTGANGILQQKEEEEEVWVPSFTGGWEKRRKEEEEERGRVRFKLVGGNSSSNGMKKMRKRSLLFCDDDDDGV